MNAFRPTLTSLDARLVPAANLLAATHADAVWVGEPVMGGGFFGDIWSGTKKVVNTTVNVIGDGVNAAGKVIHGVIYPDALAKFKTQYVALRDLRAGDILVEASNGAKAGTIGLFTGSDYTHAAIYAGNGKVIEAVGGGVRKVDVASYLNDNGIDRVMVLRVPNLSGADAARAVAFAEAQLGKGYNKAGAVALAGRDLVAAQTFGIVNPRKIEGNHNRSDYYCSQLVTAAYQSIGRPLFVSLEQSPGDLADLGKAGKLAVIGSVYDATHHRGER